MIPTPGQPSLHPTGPSPVTFNSTEVSAGGKVEGSLSLDQAPSHSWSATHEDAIGHFGQPALKILN